MRWALAIALAACAEDPRPAAPRSEHVLANEEERQEPPPEVPIEEGEPPPDRGGEHRPFEVVPQLVPIATPIVTSGERSAIVTFVSEERGWVAVIDLRTGAVRGVRPAPPCIDRALLAPGERSARFFCGGAAYAWPMLHHTPIEPIPRATAAGAYSGDGRSYAFLSSDGELRIMRGSRTRTLAAASGSAIYFSPRGDRILVDGDRARLFELRRGRVIAEMRAASGQPFDPRGRFVIAHGEGTIEIRDARTGAVLREVPGRAGEIAWSREGFCTAGEIIDPSSGERREGACGVAAEPSRYVELRTEGLVHVARGRARVIEGYQVPQIDAVRAVEGAIDLAFTIGGASWIMNALERRQAPERSFAVGELRVVIDPETRAITVERNGAPIALHDVPPDVSLVCEDGSIACGAPSIDASIDGGYLVLSSGDRAFVFDVQSGERVAEIEDAPGNARFIATATRILALAPARSLLYGDGAALGRLPGAQSGSFSPDGREVALLTGRRIEIFSSADGARLRQMRVPAAASIAWREAGAIHARARGDLVRLSPANGTELSRTEMEGERAADARGARSVRCHGGSVFLFTADDREERGPLGRCPEGGAFSVTSAGPFIAWTDGERARFHRIADGEVLEIVPLDGGRALAFTETGWFEALDIPLDAVRLRTGSIARGTMHEAAGNANHRPGLIGAFIAGTPLGDATPYPMPGE